MLPSREAANALKVQPSTQREPALSLRIREDILRIAIGVVTEIGMV